MRVGRVSAIAPNPTCTLLLTPPVQVYMYYMGNILEYLTAQYLITLKPRGDVEEPRDPVHAADDGRVHQEVLRESAQQYSSKL